MQNKIKACLFIMALMTPTLVLAQSTTNSIYIDQVGDGSNITLQQQGQNNTVGSENTPLSIQGSNQNVTFNQNGSGNSIDGLVENADNVDLTINNTGDDNAVNLNIGASASVAGSSTTLDVTGSTNTVSLTQGNNSASTSATQAISITGDLNTYTSTINANDVTNNVTAAGDNNTITMLQNGHSGKTVDATVTGNSNSVTINQTSTSNVDSISINANANNSTILINQCGISGGCAQ
jgi:hypothetical protein